MGRDDAPPHIDVLVGDERLEDAASLAEARGDDALASTLYERACDYGRASDAALRAGDHARALRLAVIGGDHARTDGRVTDLIAALPSPSALAATAEAMEARGGLRAAARLFEAAAEHGRAASAFERAGMAIDAARCHEAAGDVVRAARALEARARKTPVDEEVQLALGALCSRYGKHEAAVRALQRIERTSALRRAALGPLIESLSALGLTPSAEELREEQRRLGGGGGANEDRAVASVQAARLFGRYEVLREVASSPSARVLECMDRVRGERVAVKLFAAQDNRGSGRDALRRFEREVTALEALHHPNVVAIREYVPDGPALVLDWMESGSLADLLARGPVSPRRAAEIAVAVLRALGEAHRLGVLHRDVKPANVLFDGAGVPKLADFGAAHLSDLTATATAAVVGTVGYMSPEQRAGEPATVRSDIFGVGAILLEMLTGAPAPERRDSDAPLPSGVHADLSHRHDETVLAMVAATPSARPQSAFEAIRRIDSLPWTDHIEPVARRTTARPDEPDDARARVRRADDGSTYDLWLERRFGSVAATPVALERARAFATAAHPSLQTIYRFASESDELWLSTPAGEFPKDGLDARQIRDLGEALEALHTRNLVHGAVDSAHVRVDETGHVTLLFTPDAIDGATIDRDRLALSRLRASSARPPA